MLKNVFKGKKKAKDKDKDKKMKNKYKKSSSMDDHNAKKERKLKEQTSLNKSKRSQTNSHEMENTCQSKKKKKKSQSSNSSKKKKKKSIAHSSAYELYDKKYELNDYISLKNKRKGFIRYVGNVHFGNGQWFGIELNDGTIGNHNGKVGNKRYFKTASKCAIFVTKDQIKKTIRKSRSNHSSSQHPSMRNSNSYSSNSSHNNNKHRSSSSKKKKRKKEKASNSLKKSNANQSKQQTKRHRATRPNSAKKFEEVFFNENIIPFKPKRSVPPPPPPPQTHTHTHAHVHKSNEKQFDIKNNRKSYSNSHSHSHSSQSQSIHSNSKSPQPEHVNSLDNSNNNISKSDHNIAMGIPIYSLQHTNETNISNMSNELSPVYDEQSSTSPLNKHNNNKNNNNVNVAKHFFPNKNIKIKQQPLMSHKSYNSVPLNHKNKKTISNPIRKNRSYGDELKKKNSSEYGLSLHEFYKNYNLNDPAVQKLQYLQNSIRRTQNKSQDLEQLLSETPPSLPPTPINDRMNLNKQASSSSNSTNSSSRFQFKRQRSKSDSTHEENKNKNKNKSGGKAYKKRQSKIKLTHKVSNEELRSESEDTDIEDMYNEYENKNENNETHTQTAGNGEEEEKEITRPRSHNTMSKNTHKKTVIIHDEIDEFEFKSNENDHDSSVISDMIITPRAVGTDACSRIRSRSIQNRLAQKKKEYYVNHHNGNQISIKTAKDICPFWNPFSTTGGTCPYLSISTECTLKHLNKREYLARLNEDDTIELLTLLFCDSLFIESCVVIEKLLRINPMNDEYNTCFGDILEELGRYLEAEKYYQRALEINPMYDDAHNNYAMMLHHKLGRYGEAEQQYNKCLEINNLHCVCHTNYAKLLQYTHRYKQAEVHFKACLNLNEENVNCQHYFGIFLYEMGRWSESKYHLSKAIQLNIENNNASYHYNYAKLLCDLKEFHEANQQFKYCLKVEPENAAFNFEYALFLAFDLKDIVASIKYFVKAYELEPLNNLIHKKYLEIANIVSENGLTKIKRRKSSARFGASKRSSSNQKNNTIVEYKQDEEEENERNIVMDPCQTEFNRFLCDNFSFGENCLNIYLNKFKHCELNDIRYIVAIDLETLRKDISMKKIHAKIMMNKMEKFKCENEKFIQWLSGIHLNEYYEIFEQNGILTFESFYFHIHSNADLIRILGDRNASDVKLIWNKCPKFIRQNSMSSSFSSHSKSKSNSVEEHEIDGHGGIITGNHEIEGKQNIN